MKSWVCVESWWSQLFWLSVNLCNVSPTGLWRFWVTHWECEQLPHACYKNILPRFADFRPVLSEVTGKERGCVYDHGNLESRVFQQYMPFLSCFWIKREYPDFIICVIHWDNFHFPNEENASQLEDAKETALSIGKTEEYDVGLVVPISVKTWDFIYLAYSCVSFDLFEPRCP